MGGVEVFRFEGFRVRTVPIEGVVWFVARDVTEALGLSNGRDAVSRLDQDGVGNADVIDSMGRAQPVRVLSEAALYELIFQSRVPGAVGFKKWVTSVVLPEVRRTGSYGVRLSDDEIVRRALQITTAKVQELEARVAADAPKVLFADSVAASEGTILVGDLAKILRGNGVQVGATRLFDWLRCEGYLVRRRGAGWNMPTQKSMELGLFRVKETAVTHSDGHVSLSRTPKVTGRGQAYFIDRFLRERQVV